MKLPELPEPDHIVQTSRTSSESGYSADQLRAYGQACASAATLAERERCARLCDSVYAEERGEPVCYGFAKDCADAIRAEIAPNVHPK
jgi:hypothetical protein